MSRIKIIFLGPLPPPFMGPSVATQIILNSKLKDEFDLIHLDTSDHRNLNKLGSIDFRNVSLALRHYCILISLIITKWPSLVYIPISQTTIGYLRDAGFIIISKLFGLRVVCHLRGGNFKNWYNSSAAITRCLVRSVHLLVDGQIVLGNSLKYMFNGIVPEKKLFVVPNGRDFKIITHSQKHPDMIRILYLANFIRTKGVLDTLKAAPDVYNFAPKTEFIFAGTWFDEYTKREFEAFTKEYPKLPIILKGAVYGQDKCDLFHSSDIFVFPSYYPAEGHPWVIVEALAFGLPIISTDQGAITESVIDKINGFIVEKQNSHQIAEKIKLLIDDSDLRKTMGQASRRLYLKNFTEEKMAERLSRTFNSVLTN